MNTGGLMASRSRYIDNIEADYAKVSGFLSLFALRAHCGRDARGPSKSRFCAQCPMSAGIL